MHLQRQRYVLFEIQTFKVNIVFNQSDIIKEIWNSFQKLFGDYNSYKLGLWMVDYDDVEKIGILRCTNITKEMLIASLSFISRINNYPVIIHTKKASGTIKKILKIKSQMENKNGKIFNSIKKKEIP